MSGQLNRPNSIEFKPVAEKASRFITLQSKTFFLAVVKAKTLSDQIRNA
jgi:hypothetical protein